MVLLIVRRLTGWLAQVRTAMRQKERAVVALFGIRGIGTLFHLSYALGQDSFSGLDRELWVIVALTVVMSVVLHGGMATPPSITWIDGVTGQGSTVARRWQRTRPRSPTSAALR
ncbi:hypothetical protein [Streptomyces cadmiisoli]|uniref:hypothetical protein n=1 Tax=Streptomyces cadmiisoli TaxID=2184053 RepID=UPI003D72E6FB